jgi:hypothetical protein
MTTISIPIDDFVRCNKGLLRLLLALYRKGGGVAGNEGLSTTKLYKAAGMSNNYSYIVLQRAERMGFIERKKVPKPKGLKGNVMVVNRLTNKGRRLLSSLDLI